MSRSENIGALAKAIALSQVEVENATKGVDNTFFKSKYADLATVLNVIRPVFSRHNVAIVQLPTFEAGVVKVETMLIHESGEYISSICSSPVGKQDAQGIGSAITYLRRYSLAAMCGIAQEDDDANSSVGHTQPAKAASQSSQPKQPAKATQKPTISPEQEATIIALANEVNVDLQKTVIEKKKVTKLTDLPADSYNGLIDWLETHRTGGAA